MSGMDAILYSLLEFDRASSSWMDRALCKGDKEDIWFPEPPGQGAGRPPKRKDSRRPAITRRERYDQQVAFAISICEDCPVRSQCRADAESRNERHGIWGGKDFYAPVSHAAKAS